MIPQRKKGASENMLPEMHEKHEPALSDQCIQLGWLHEQPSSARMKNCNAARMRNPSGWGQ